MSIRDAGFVIVAAPCCCDGYFVAGKRIDEDVVAFMADVMARLGVENASQLATMAVEQRWMRITQARKIARWVTGESAPSHHDTMRLLREAGLLRGELAAPTEAARGGAPPDQSAPPDELLESIQELVGLLREALPHLQKLPAARQPAAGSRKRAAT